MEVASSLEPGVVVFGRVKGHPWWPAVIACFPDTSDWRRTTDDRIWCMFFNEANGAWLKLHEIRPFDDCHREECLLYNRSSSRHRRFLGRIAEAMECADRYLMTFQDNMVKEEPPTPLAPWAKSTTKIVRVPSEDGLVRNINVLTRSTSNTGDRDELSKPVELTKTPICIKQSGKDLDESTDSGADIMQGSSDCDERVVSSSPPDTNKGHHLYDSFEKKESAASAEPSSSVGPERQPDSKTTLVKEDSIDEGRPRRKRTKSMRYDDFIDPSHSARRSSRIQESKKSTTPASGYCDETVVTTRYGTHPPGIVTCSDQMPGSTVPGRNNQREDNPLKVRLKLSNLKNEETLVLPLSRDKMTSNDQNIGIDSLSSRSRCRGTRSNAPMLVSSELNIKQSGKPSGRRSAPPIPTLPESAPTSATAGVAGTVTRVKNRHHGGIGKYINKSNVQSHVRDATCSFEEKVSADITLPSSSPGSGAGLCVKARAPMVVTRVKNSRKTPARSNRRNRNDHKSEEENGHPDLGVETDSEKDPEATMLPISGRMDIGADKVLDAILSHGRMDSGSLQSIEPHAKRKKLFSDQGDIIRLLLHRVSAIEAEVASLKSQALSRERCTMGEDATAAGLKSAVEALVSATEAFARKRDFEPHAISRALDSLWDHDETCLNDVDGDMLQALARSLVMSTCRRHRPGAGSS